MGAKSGRVPLQMMVAENCCCFLARPSRPLSTCECLLVRSLKDIPSTSRVCIKPVTVAWERLAWLLETHQHTLDLRRPAGLCMKLELKRLPLTTWIKAARRELLPDIHVLISSY